MSRPTRTIFITGVHHTPAIELIRQLREDKQYRWNIHYLSHFTATDTHLHQFIIPLVGRRYHPLKSIKFDRHNIWKTIFRTPFFFNALAKSFFLCRKFQPDIIVSFGGYISVPVVLAGYLNHIKSISHEQTPIPGLATRINANFNYKIATSFPIKNFFPQKSITTGNLLRREIFNSKPPLSLKVTKPLIYVTGGSQGSEFINDLLTQSISRLTRFNFIHQTGIKPTTIKPSPKYQIFPYVSIENIGPILNNSEIIITRSGANICAEIDALNKKAIVIPLPTSQQNEQLKNALWLKKQHPGNIIILEQNKATPATLVKSIKKLLTTRTKSPSNHQVPINTKLLQLIHEII